jgi:hypothetical protein
MGKNKAAKQAKMLTRDVTVVPFRIQIPSNDGHVPAGNLIASGSGEPDGSAVIGILTETTTGVTIQSNSTIGAPPSTWNLGFQNVPAGSYVLAAQQIDPLTGADAINITVDSVVPPIVIRPITPGSTTIVTGTCDDATHISGVVSSPKPKHGTPRTQIGSTNFMIRFTGLTSGNHTVTVFPIRGGAKAQSKTFTVP